MTSIVVGGGISAMAAAAGLAEVGPVTIIDRAYRLGGRMAVVTLREGPWTGHVVDVGAAYVTARSDAFGAVVEDWEHRGLLRPWTTTLAVADGDHVVGQTDELQRYAAPNGLRSLVEDLARQLPAHVRIFSAVNAQRFLHGAAGFTVHARSAHTGMNQAHRGRALALCMPGPQAISLLGSDPTAAGEVLTAAAGQRYAPIVTLIAQWPTRSWEPLSACFVNNNATLSFVADDGHRRGDGAAVLVAHSTPELAEQYLTTPEGATDHLVDALRRLLQIADGPTHVDVRRWSLAKPLVRDDVIPPYALIDSGLGLAGDAFDSRPRVEAAWLSGHHLGRAMAAGIATSEGTTA